MQTLTLTRAITLPANVLLALTPAQAGTRAHLLDSADVDDGIYLTLAETQFKAGETIGLDDISVLPKDVAAVLTAMPAPVPTDPVSPPAGQKAKRAPKAGA